VLRTNFILQFTDFLG